MDATAFYQHVRAAFACPPTERHAQLAHLHTEALRDYHAVLRYLSAQDVLLPLPNQSDSRTIAQIISHIAAWDRFALLAAGDILGGIPHPRMITDLTGYREDDGTLPDFANIDDFNAYQADKYRTWSWEQLRFFADDTATTLHVLFTHPQLLSAARLEQTLPFRKRLQNGIIIDNITMGWNLWLTMVEHLAVEHADLMALTHVG